MTSKKSITFNGKNGNVKQAKTKYQKYNKNKYIHLDINKDIYEKLKLVMNKQKLTGINDTIRFLLYNYSELELKQNGGNRNEKD